MGAGLELTHRHSPGPLDPGALGIPHRDAQHDLGLAGAHLASPDRGGEERPRPQLARQPRHAHGGSPGDPEDLAGVVGEAGVAEPQHPVAHRELAQPVADGHVDCAPPPGHPRQEAVDEQRALPPVEPAPGLGNLELPGTGGQLLEHHVE